MSNDDTDIINMILGIEESTPEQKKNFEDFSVFQDGLAEDKSLTAEQKINRFKGKMFSITGVELPKNVCICESEAGYMLLITTKDTDPDEYTDYMDIVFEYMGRRGGASNSALKNVCSGNYVRTD